MELCGHSMKLNGQSMRLGAHFSDHPNTRCFVFILWSLVVILWNFGCHPIRFGGRVQTLFYKSMSFCLYINFQANEQSYRFCFFTKIFGVFSRSRESEIFRVPRSGSSHDSQERTRVLIVIWKFKTFDENKKWHNDFELSILDASRCPYVNYVEN